MIILLKMLHFAIPTEVVRQPHDYEARAPQL